jgi:hypothetical protein
MEAEHAFCGFALAIAECRPARPPRSRTCRPRGWEAELRRRPATVVRLVLAEPLRDRERDRPQTTPWGRSSGLEQLLSRRLGREWPRRFLKT